MITNLLSFLAFDSNMYNYARNRVLDILFTLAKVFSYDTLRTRYSR